MSYFINIRYTEGEGQDSYEGIELSNKEHGVSILFHQGFIEDWSNMMHYLRNNVEGDELVLHSSSVDSFFYEDPQRYEYVDGCVSCNIYMKGDDFFV